jgi:hypothetical protein
VLTLFIAAPPNGSSVWVRAVERGQRRGFEQEITTDLPANTQFLSPAPLPEHRRDSRRRRLRLRGPLSRNRLLKGPS